jgi:hypothetical protein
MSDTLGTTDSATTAPGTEAPATEATTPAVTDTGAAAEPELSTFGEHADYIKQLRAEAAERRTALKPFNDAFDGYEDTEREFLLDLARGLKDPNARAETVARAMEVFKALTPEQQAEVTAAEGAEGEDLDRPMTLREYQEAQAKTAEERAAAETQAQIDADTKAVKQEATDLGYNEGTREYRRLMDVALHETKGDLKAAHEALEAERKTVIEGYLNEKRGQRSQTLRNPGGTGAPADQSTAPKTLAQAREATLARLKALQA